ncbi:hypothetical protein C8R44DRAFT_946713 [Mycena epipterygia]|nr:hypothetical protein C8R44DRAFT_946713 [Mycena epipterygia]
MPTISSYLLSSCVVNPNSFHPEDPARWIQMRVGAILPPPESLGEISIAARPHPPQLSFESRAFCGTERVAMSKHTTALKVRTAGQSTRLVSTHIHPTQLFALADRPSGVSSVGARAEIFPWSHADAADRARQALVPENACIHPCPSIPALSGGANTEYMDATSIYIPHAIVCHRWCALLADAGVLLAEVAVSFFGNCTLAWFSRMVFLGDVYAQGYQAETGLAATTPASPFAMPMTAPTISPDDMLRAYAAKHASTATATPYPLTGTTAGAEVVPSLRGTGMRVFYKQLEDGGRDYDPGGAGSASESVKPRQKKK